MHQSPFDLGILHDEGEGPEVCLWHVEPCVGRNATDTGMDYKARSVVALAEQAS